MNYAAERTDGNWSAKKILLGAGIGCGALVLLFVVAAVGAGYWAYMPGKQVATSTILSDDSVAFLRVQSLGQDAGVTQLLETVIVQGRKAQAGNRRQLPGFYRWLMAQQIKSARKDAQQASEMLAREITVTLELVPDHRDPRPVIAVNLSRFARLIRFVWWLVSDPDRSPLDSKEPLKLAFVESTMILAPPDLLAQVTARVEGRAGMVDPNSEIFKAYQSANPRWDVHGLALNRGNTFEYLSRIFESAKEDLPAEAPTPALDPYRSIKQISFGVDVVSDDEIEAKITVDSDNPELAKEILEKALAELKRSVSDTKHALRSEAAIDQELGKTVLSLRIANLRQALIRAIRGSRAEEDAPSERDAKR